MPAQGLAGWASQLFAAVDAHQTLTVCAAALALSQPNSYLFLVSVPPLLTLFFRHVDTPKSQVRGFQNKGESVS